MIQEEVDLCFAIAKHLGFEESFTHQVGDEGEDYMFDAECATIPNYVKILSHDGARQLRLLLEIVANNAHVS